MIDVLERHLIYLPVLMQDREAWSSLVINKRKPFTYRAFAYVNDIRICLHRFEECDAVEAFDHPHAWPAAFKILKGSYKMNIKYADSPAFEPRGDPAISLIMTAGSSYEMTNPMTFHTIQPLEECFTVMVNAPPWPIHARHDLVRTTKGKDLQSMSEKELDEHFEIFAQLLKDR